VHLIWRERSTGSAVFFFLRQLGSSAGCGRGSCRNDSSPVFAVPKRIIVIRRSCLGLKARVVSEDPCRKGHRGFVLSCAPQPRDPPSPLRFFIPDKRPSPCGPHGSFLLRYGLYSKGPKMKPSNWGPTSVITCPLFLPHVISFPYWACNRAVPSRRLLSPLR
jgi:hypothetical protein